MTYLETATWYNHEPSTATAGKVQLLNVNYVALMETAEDDGSDDSGAVALTSALSAAFVIASLVL